MSKLDEPTALIDKIEMYLCEAVPLGGIISKADVAGIRHRLVKHPANGKWSTGFWHQLHDPLKDEPIIYVPQRPDRTAQKFYINPSRLAYFTTLYAMVRSLLLVNDVYNAKITRIDFAVDYPVGLAAVIAGTSIRFKRCARNYSSKSNKATGIEIGKGPPVVAIYDKGIQRRLTDGHELTRIEVRLKGRHKPVAFLRELPSIRFPSPKTLKRFDPFQHIHLQNVTLKDFSELECTAIQAQRYGQLKAFVATQGYSAARQHLGKNKNFSRDYLPFMNRLPWPYEQPSQVMRKHFVTYFRTWKKAYASMAIRIVTDSASRENNAAHGWVH